MCMIRITHCILHYCRDLKLLGGWQGGKGVRISVFYNRKTKAAFVNLANLMVKCGYHIVQSSHWMSKSFQHSVVDCSYDKMWIPFLIEQQHNTSLIFTKCKKFGINSKYNNADQTATIKINQTLKASQHEREVSEYSYCGCCPNAVTCCSVFQSLINIIKESGVKGFWDVIIARDVSEGLCQL